MLIGVLPWRAVDETPQELAEARPRFQIQERFRVRDCSFDLAAMADDPFVLEQACDLSLPVARHGLRIEIVKGARKASRLRRMVIQASPAWQRFPFGLGDNADILA